MDNERIDRLEQALNLGSNPYAQPEARKAQLNFKFEIGDKVHHTAFGYNAVIMRRSYIEDKDGNYKAYDLALWNSNPPVQGESVSENYLEKGHRQE